MDATKNISVAAPEKWMDGWDKVYRQMLEASDEELTNLDVSRPIQQLLHALYITGTDLENLNVLELACGDGSAACYLAKHGCNVMGIEALVSAVELAQKRIRVLNLGEKVVVKLGDINGWDLGTAKYDAIVIIQSLQYLFDRTIPRLREIITALKPGGFFVYSGNILPHFDTDPVMRFIEEDELRKELKGWTFHCIGSDEAMIKPGDVRGYLWAVARKPQ